MIETKGSEKRYRKTEAWSLTQKSRFPAGTSCGRNQVPFTLCISSEAAKHDTKSLTVPSHIGETRATQQHRSPGKQKARHFNICILGGQDVWRTVLESELTGDVRNRATRRSYWGLWRNKSCAFLRSRKRHNSCLPSPLNMPATGLSSRISQG